MKTTNKYSHPLKEEDIDEIIYDAPAHKGKLKNSVDYKCKIGSELKAPLDGEVVFIKQDSNIGGPDKKYWNKGNYITIKHKNGEYSLCEHLKCNGATVKVGDKVKKGQLIGYSGNTGYTLGPHTHFQVFKFTGPNKNEDFETLKVKFDKKYRGLEKKIHSTLGILFLILSGIYLPFSLTGFSVSNISFKLNLIPAIFFLIAILEIYLSVKQK